MIELGKSSFSKTLCKWYNVNYVMNKSKPGLRETGSHTNAFFDHDLKVGVENNVYINLIDMWIAEDTSIYSENNKI